MAALNSDHVNYLIWRYLQEQGYGKTAVQLSRDWQNSNPQALPFAEQVKSHALVQILQDGLEYDQLVDEAGQTQDFAPIEGSSRTNALYSHGKRWAFVDTKQRKPPDRVNEEPNHLSIEDSEHRRKRQRRDTGESHHPTSGRRKSLKPEKEQDEEILQDAMEIDEEIPNDRSVQPEVEPEIIMEPEPPPPVLTLDVGKSTGMQSEKPAEDPIIETIASHSFEDADVLRAEWDSREGDALMVSGGSVCHLLRLEAAVHQPWEPNGVGLLPDSTPEYSIRSERLLKTSPEVIKWSIVQWDRQKQGSRKVTAVEEMYRGGDVRGTVKVIQDTVQTKIADPSTVVLVLKWSPTSSRILASWDSTEAESSHVTVWDSESAEPPHEVQCSRLIRDAVWLDDDQFVTCGENVLDVFDINEQSINSKANIKTNNVWDQLLFDEKSGKLICTSNEDGVLGLVNTSDFQLSTKVAHEDAITGISSCSEPRKEDTGPSTILATSCVDGTVKLWTATDALECIHTFVHGPLMPTWTIKFSPERSSLAAMTGHQVQIWTTGSNPESSSSWTDTESIKLLARWKPCDGSQANADNTDKDSGISVTSQHGNQDSAKEDSEGLSSLHSLAWDDTGNRLALTHGNHVYITKISKEAVDQEQRQQIETT